MNEPQFTDSTLEWIKNSNLTERKKLGQYMTPKNVRDILLNNLPIKAGDKVIDPAVGTGEFLKAINDKTPGCELYGWDIDFEILEVAKTVTPNTELKIHSLYDPITGYENTFDVVIGNPPYFETTLTDEQKTLFTTVAGRPNIYGLFIERYLEIVKPGGYLAFIVPPSMNAGAYFDKLRQHILKTSTIKFLEIIRHNNAFDKALTSTQAIILQKNVTTEENPYVVDFRKITNNTDAPTIFSDHKKLITEIFDNKKSIAQLGYKVITGSIPWNQHKTGLTATKTNTNYPLYYSKDISKNNTLVLNPKLEEKRFLQTPKPYLVGEAIIVNRIVGSLENPQLKLAYINNPDGFYAENHVNVILPDPTKKQLITLEELYNRIVEIKNLSGYLKALTGNTQLSAKELNHLIPL